MIKINKSPPDDAQKTTFNMNFVDALYLLIHKIVNTIKHTYTPSIFYRQILFGQQCWVCNKTLLLVFPRRFLRVCKSPAVDNKWRQQSLEVATMIIAVWHINNIVLTNFIETFEYFPKNSFITSRLIFRIVVRVEWSYIHNTLPCTAGWHGLDGQVV